VRGCSAAFEAEHTAVFFGRDRVIDQARRRLVEAMGRGTPFLLIVGASGAGKSSLARAGLIPRLTTPAEADNSRL
jgi:predicted GTPase